MDGLSALYNRWGVRLAYAATFLLPLKLSLCYITLIPLVLLCIAHYWTRPKEILSTLGPFIYFVIVASICSLFGLRPIHSLGHLAGFAFFAFSIFSFRDFVLSQGILRPLSTLLVGQTIASFHSILDAAFPESVPSLFVGQVSESGQLSISLVLAVGLFLSLQQTGTFIKNMCYAAFGFAGCIVLAFAPSFTLPIVGRIAVTSAVGSLCGWGIVILWQVIRSKGSHAMRVGVALAASTIPALSAAFLVNLKRGPWLGVGIGVLILLIQHGKRVLIPIFAAVIALWVLLTPLRERIEQSPEHFYISGGRYAIWQVGFELMTRYPLGIGFGNSAFLKEFDPEIPHNLKHFHNNFLNVVVETGWMAFGLYLWWLVWLIQIAFRGKGSGEQELIFRHAVGCALISWQVAGIVEYSFGDSEVLLMAWWTIGLLMAIKIQEVTSKTQN